MKYWYGMRLRPVDIGAQPKEFLEYKNDPTKKYWNLVCYERKLTDEEIFVYSMDLITTEK